MTQLLERDEKEFYGALFAGVEKRLPGSGLDWLRKRRAGAAASFGKTGFPTSRDEAWRFTSPAPLRETRFQLPERPRPVSADQARGALCLWTAARLVFVDGFFSPELSALPRAAGLSAASLGELLSGGAGGLDSFWDACGEWGGSLVSLNTAFFQDGAYLRLEDGAAVPEPVQIAFLWSAGQDPRSCHPRVIIDAGAGSRLTVIEESASLARAASWLNRAAEFRLGQDARLDYYQVQHGAPAALETTHTRAALSRQSRFNSRVFIFGGALVRNEIKAEILEEGAECALNGLYLARGRDHVDNHTLIEHSSPRGVSRELYKGVLDGQAQAVFEGSITVKPQAQKTDAMVYNKNLLLSDKGWVNTKPEFKIFANDVQCKHGSTIGQLREEALFYLRSRGIAPNEARRMLIGAFAAEMLDGVLPEGLRQALARRLGDFSGLED